jgi:hypothetical protein
MNIKRQGYFREMPHGDEADPSIKDFVGKADSRLIDKIVNYLENGVGIIICAGSVDDVINPGKGSAGVPSVLTDGTWFWPGDLAYYVKNYKVALADDFVTTMEQNDWKNPVTYDELDFDNLSVDGEFIFKE